MRAVGLILVFALALPANAALSLYIDDSQAPSGIELLTDEELTIQIHSSDTSNWLGYIILESGGVGALYNLVELWRDPPAIIYDPDVDDPEWGTGFSLVVDSISPLPLPGLQFTVDYSSSETGTAVISLWVDPDYTTAVDTLDITVVPEPATVALLALGGLAVLTKRKT